MNIIKQIKKAFLFAWEKGRFLSLVFSSLIPRKTGKTILFVYDDFVYVKNKSQLLIMHVSEFRLLVGTRNKIKTGKEGVWKG